MNERRSDDEAWRDYTQEVGPSDRLAFHAGFLAGRRQDASRAPQAEAVAPPNPRLDAEWDAHMNAGRQILLGYRHDDRTLPGALSKWGQEDDRLQSLGAQPATAPNPGLERALELLSGVFCLGDDDREKLDKAIAILRGTDGDSRLVTVCSECKQASCWQGKFYCDKAKMAGTVELTVAQLREMALEHPDNWRAE